MTQIATKQNLQRVVTNVKEKFVAKKAGYDLSKNDFTDEYKAKLEKAGESDFSGDYDDLENKPAIDGTELDASSTAAGLGLAKASDLPGAATTAKAGLVKPDGTTIKVLADGTISAEQPDLDGYLTANDLTDYAKTSAVTSAISEAKTELEGTMDTKITAAKGDIDKTIDSKVGTAKEELESEIASAVAGAINYKGSVAFDSLPALSGCSVGDLYNLTTSGTTDANWKDGTGKKVEAGTNVAVIEDGNTKMWDAMTLAFDPTGLVKESDIETISESEIDAMFE